jgi:signal transduction histidine kinase
MADRPTQADPSQAERLHHFAHDLRNRLAAIQQVMQQLRSTVDPDNEELLTFAEQQYFRAMRSTEDLLDDLAVDRLPRLSAMHPVDMAELVHQAAADIGHRLQRKQQHLDLHLPAGLVVHGDKHWLKELVNALLTNASKFSPKAAHITVALQSDRDRIILTVTDPGVGMSASDLQQAFVRYAWLESRSTDGEPQGRSTLARARQWAEAHQGTLDVASEGPGKGCRFTLALPAASTN